jgi:hypothetical protein
VAFARKAAGGGRLLEASAAACGGWGSEKLGTPFARMQAANLMAATSPDALVDLLAPQAARTSPHMRAPLARTRVRRHGMPKV